MVAWGLRRMHQDQQQQQQHTVEAEQQQQEQHTANSLQKQQQQQQGFHITSLGVEAQTVSYQLAQRSIRYNLGPRHNQQQVVQVINQDLRDRLPGDDQQLFQLITGTPPYIPKGFGGRSLRPQKEPCCLEVRGGIEDYCMAAAQALAAAGVFVACMGLQGQPAHFKGKRTQLAAAAAGLVIVRQVSVITREGKPPLFAVYVMRKAAEVLQDQHYWQHLQQTRVVLKPKQEQIPFRSQVLSGQLDNIEDMFVVQHADGGHTDAWHAAREAMGLPPLS